MFFWLMAALDLTVDHRFYQCVCRWAAWIVVTSCVHLSLCAVGSHCWLLDWWTAGRLDLLPRHTLYVLTSGPVLCVLVDTRVLTWFAPDLVCSLLTFCICG